MENQKLDYLTTETRIDLSKNLLEDPEVEQELEPDRTDEDFRQQNDIINQELKKYDKLLRSWPLIIYRIWLRIYFTLLVISALFVILLLVVMFQPASNWSWIGFIFLLITFLFLCVSSYGCVLVRIALHSKSLPKVERCIKIFKLLMILSTIFFFANLASDLYQKLFDWGSFWTDVSGPLVAIINLVTAMYVKKVLLKRDVFQQVSSYQ